jgi:hypothetical protein
MLKVDVEKVGDLFWESKHAKIEKVRESVKMGWVEESMRKYVESWGWESW